MTKKLGLYLFFVCLSNYMFGQNIFDKSSSFNYAKNLICEENYSLALKTINPFVNFTKPDSIESLAIHCLFKLERNQELFPILKNSFDRVHLNSAILNQLGAICLSYDTFSPILNTIDLSVFDPELRVRMLLITNKYSQAISLINENSHKLDSTFFFDWIKRKNQIKKINPRKYMLSSAIIPGSGKMLIGETFEGLTSLIIVASHTYLSIISFQLNGISSVFGWVNVGMGLSFYGGNIIGTQRAIKRHSDYQNQLLLNELKSNLYSTFYNPNCN